MTSHRVSTRSRLSVRVGKFRRCDSNRAAQAYGGGVPAEVAQAAEQARVRGGARFKSCIPWHELVRLIARIDDQEPARLEYASLLGAGLPDSEYPVIQFSRRAFDADDDEASELQVAC